MIKNLTLLVLSLLFFQVVKAQKATDTLLYYMKDSGRLVANKDSADYFMFIMPMDSTTKLSAINEYYRNGKPKLLGVSSSREYFTLYFVGATIAFYPNGMRESIINYKRGIPSGDITTYYPNGGIYHIVTIDNSKKYKLIECRDTSGIILAKDGNGKWLDFDNNFSNIKFIGTISDSVKIGVWYGKDKGRTVFESTFNKGKFISGVYYDTTGEKHPFDKEEVEPSYKNGFADFYAYLTKKVKYPDIDREAGVSGKVIVTFVIEKDGSLTSIKADRSPDESLAKAVVDVIKSSPPWNPAFQNGQPVRVQYTISFKFSLANTK